MKRIFSVEISLTVMVCAESKEEAAEYVERNSDMIAHEGRHGAVILSHGEVTDPGKDDAAGIPWGHCDDAQPDRTVGEWVALAKAAPPADPRQVTLPGVES